MLTLHSISFPAMGTDCGLNFYAVRPADAQRISQAAIEEVARIESRYSRYRLDSQLSAINRVAEVGGSIDVDDETAGLLNYAFAAYRKSDGLFDISSGLLRKAWDFKRAQLADQTVLNQLLLRIGLAKVTWQAPRLTFNVPEMELDFGGFVKEYAADQVARTCKANGVEHGVVDLGGDICIVGPQPLGEPWTIGIRHPRQPGEIMATALMMRGALATSGDYERCIEINGTRYSHILNPKTGWPTRGLCSVTAIAEQCLVAGSVSTIAMLKGRDGIGWLKTLNIDYCWMDEHQGRFQIGAFATKD